MQAKYTAVVLNLVVAVAISLVVNFSHMLLLFVDRNDTQPLADEQLVYRNETGRVTVCPDGYGYVIYPAGDSVYIPQWRLRRLSLHAGERVVVAISEPRSEGGHPVMERLLVRNGAPFDYTTLYKRPSDRETLMTQLLYYLIVSFVLLSILTFSRGNRPERKFFRRCIGALIAASVLYFVAPVTQWQTGRIVLNFTQTQVLDPMVLLKCSFAVAVSFLYGWIYVLLSRQRAIEVENEQLKTENLSTRYNMLVGQINPHFFFNSLNSLAMLVREKEPDKALTYIDQLSYTFRYIIQSGQTMLVTLDEELAFAKAYGYLFKIRYEDKLFFDTAIEARYRHWLLPSLTVQPLIGNAVKHNAITTAKPLRISIRTEQGTLVISNPRAPKLDPEPSTGIGLENLRNRWQLIMGSDIEIIETATEFTVRMPLRRPETEPPQRTTEPTETRTT